MLRNKVHLRSVKTLNVATAFFLFFFSARFSFLVSNGVFLLSLFPFLALLIVNTPKGVGQMLVFNRVKSY